jgi:hypothetical protein
MVSLGIHASFTALRLRRHCHDHPSWMMRVNHSLLGVRDSPGSIDSLGEGKRLAKAWTKLDNRREVVKDSGGVVEGRLCAVGAAELMRVQVRAVSQGASWRGCTRREARRLRNCNRNQECIRDLGRYSQGNGPGRGGTPYLDRLCCSELTLQELGTRQCKFHLAAFGESLP